MQITHKAMGSAGALPIGKCCDRFRLKPRDIRQAIDILERHHPTWIFRWQGTDIIQLFYFFIREFDLGRSQVFCELIRALGADDHRRNERLGKYPGERDGGYALIVTLGDWPQDIQDSPGPLFVYKRKVESRAA